MLARLLSRYRIHLAGGFLALAGVVLIIGVVALSSDGPGQVSDAPTRDDDPPSDPIAAPTFTPDPLPEPEPDPEPVVGEVEFLGVTDLSTSGVGLFQPGTQRDQPVPTDDASVTAFVAAVADWIDSAITSANLDAATTDTAGFVGPEELVLLGDPQMPTTAAHYTVAVGARGVPEWAEVVVAASSRNGVQRHARLVFAAEETGATLLAAGPAEDIAPDLQDAAQDRTRDRPSDEAA